MAASLGFLWMKYEGKVEDLTEANSRLELLEYTIKLRDQKLKEEQERRDTLARERDQIRSEFSEVREELLRLKGQHQTVIEYPEEAEQETQFYFEDFMQDIQCLTGDRRKC